jgi:16S rRNA (cytidine1402-2'-O)-methyltransferase
MDQGILYLVPTPIGNLKDMTYRAVEVLKSVYRIYAEDTRSSRSLLIHYNIETPCFSYHKYNERQRASELLASLNNGLSIAIISDAGSPGISDPSNIIVKECINSGITVCPLPGATAFVPAITASGFDSEHFLMFGFLPNKKTELDNLMDEIINFPYPVIFYESPHRILETLNLIKAKLGDRKICISREISKLFESWYRGNISEIIKDEQLKTKGEFVLIIGPQETKDIDDDQIIKEIAELSNSYSKKELSLIISEKYKISKKRVYELSIKHKDRS